MGTSESITGRMSDGNAPVEAFRVMRSQKSGYYSAIETTVNNLASDVALTSLVGASDFWDQLPAKTGNFFEIYSSSDITIKFRTSRNAGTTTANLKSIKVLGNSYRTVSFMADVTEIYFSNLSGANATVEVVAI